MPQNSAEILCIKKLFKKLLLLPVQLSREILHFVGLNIVLIKLVKSTKFKNAASSRDYLSTGYPRQSDLNWSRHTLNPQEQNILLFTKIFEFLNK